MVHTGRITEQDVIAVILGGGAGTRLFPLTKERSKPAVPLGGKYRLVDIPISNCLNSGLRRIFVLTQFNSTSLHRHIQQSYRFDDFSRGFVEILAAQQTPGNPDWYQGTADAVRQNLTHFDDYSHDLALILSGDQLYRMDFRLLMDQHVRTGADVTVAAIPVSRADAPSLGIVRTDGEGRIRQFVEKPQNPAVLEGLRIPPGAHSSPEEELYLASMGIYLFDRAILAQALSGTETDFGKHVIPAMIDTHSVYAYIYRGYWEDIGTIRAFYEANLNLAEPLPKFNFFDVMAPVYTRARYLPASKITRGHLDRAVIAEGCILVDATVERSIIGIRSRVEAGTVIRNSVVMGQDYYETEGQLAEAVLRGQPRIGIGRNTFIEGAIVDKNARIGDGVRISPEGKPPHLDGDNFYIRDGIVIIPKNATIPSGTVI